MKTFSCADLSELDEQWPLGKKLVVPESGTIVVAGAYRGRYLHYLSELFPTAGLFGYEPQKAAFHQAQRRVEKAVVFNYGLGSASRSVTMGNTGTDGASVINPSGFRKLVELRDASEVLGVYPVIDLLVMNMEGYEWALIPYLLAEMMHHRIKSMAIQFHPEYVCPERAGRVFGELLWYYHHENYWDYPTWTYWQRRK